MIKKLIFLALFVAAAGSTAFADAPIFTGCPPYAAGSHCDSIYFQVSAINPASNGADRNIRYHLVQGPGTIDEKTGLWICHPELLDPPRPGSYPVEISASLGQETTTTETNCHFEVNVMNQYPEFGAGSGAHVTILPGDALQLPIAVTEHDPCDDLAVSVYHVRPEPEGILEYDADAGILTFIPAAADADTTFEVILNASDGFVDRRWTVFIETFTADPIVFKLSSVKDAEVGDTVAIDLTLTESPIGLGRIELMLDYDESRLRFLDYATGDPFYSPETGCGWDRLNIYPLKACPESDVGMLLRISALSDDGQSPDPTCFRPAAFPAVLGTIYFVVEGPTPQMHEISPLSFYWCRCDDNVALDSRGRNWIYTRAVRTPEGRVFKPQPLPGYAGTSFDCFFNTTHSGERFHQMELWNGLVNIVGDTTPAPIQVRIQRQEGDGEGVLQGQETTVDILLDKADRELGGFNLHLGFDATSLSFVSVTPGILQEECEWEYFQYRYGADGPCGDQCPSGLLRIVSMAETNNGDIHPSCFIPSSFPASLATIRFLVSNDRTLVGAFLPIGFFWNDCGDNSIASGDGRVLLGSNKVFSSDGHWIEADTSFPSWGGAILSCDASDRGLLTRAIDFYNGGVQILGGHDLDCTGDINFNGQPYELMDAVLYSDYVLLGPGDSTGEDCNDIDKDGIPATCADWTLMAKIVLGEAEPGPLELPPVVTSCCVATGDTNRVSLEHGESICASLIVIEGEAKVVTTPPSSLVLSKVVDGDTRVFIFYDWVSRDTLGSIGTLGVPLLTYVGSSNIKEIYAATRDAAPALISLGCQVGDINLNGTPYEIADAVMFTNYFMHGPDAFLGRYEQTLTVGDINGDGISLDLVDFVFFVHLVVGDIGPDYPPQPPVDADYCIVAGSPNALYLQPGACVSNLFLQFEGEATDLSASDGSTVYSFFDGEVTRVLTDELSDSCMTVDDQPFLTWTGSSQVTALSGVTPNIARVVFHQQCPTGIDEGDAALPTRFELAHNYPNPFNPQTTIPFALPHSAHVTITVYNITGQEVVRLIDGHMNAGFHEIRWNGCDAGGHPVASGIYFYKLAADDFVQTKKMMLLK